jgi:dethiobiotin synthase
VKPAVLFVTASDTNVGKTVFATLLTHHLRARGFRVAGLKPICSGGRGDALALQAAAGKVLTLDEVNPWHFRAAIAPLLAARQARRRVRLREVVAHIRRITRRFDLVVVEGAGGLLSPLGEGFDSRDLIRALSAVPVIICANRLGTVNQALLVLRALPCAAARRAQLVLMAPTRADPASRANPPLLREFAGRTPVHELPRLRQPAAPDAGLRRAEVRRSLDAVLHGLVD